MSKYVRHVSQCCNSPCISTYSRWTPSIEDIRPVILKIGGTNANQAKCKVGEARINEKRGIRTTQRRAPMWHRSLESITRGGVQQTGEAGAESGKGGPGPEPELRVKWDTKEVSHMPDNRALGN